MVLVIEDKKLWEMLMASGPESDPDRFSGRTGDREDRSVDDPGTEQRSSKTEPDGDGEEQLR